MGLRIDQTDINDNASEIKTAAGYFAGKDLGSEDSKSTISANDNSKDAFDEEENTLITYGNSLITAANNIENLGSAFTDFDELMAEANRG